SGSLLGDSPISPLAPPRGRGRLGRWTGGRRLLPLDPHLSRPRLSRSSSALPPVDRGARGDSARGRRLPARGLVVQAALSFHGRRGEPDRTNPCALRDVA